MVQYLAELAALAEDLGPVPNTHMVAHNYLSIRLQGLWYILPRWVPTSITYTTKDNKNI